MAFGQRYVLAPEAASLNFDRALAISKVAENARRPINTDLLVAALADGTLDLSEIQAGTALSGKDVKDGESAEVWTEIQAKEGAFAAIGRSTYVLVQISSEVERVMMLEASGHGVAYVNGEPRMGDAYGHGYVTLPVLIKRGENTLLFAHAGRGGMRAALKEPTSEVMIQESDLTLPDARSDRETEAFIGVPLINATNEVKSVTLWAQAGAGESSSEVLSMPPCTVVKASMLLTIGKGEGTVPLKIRVNQGPKVHCEHVVNLKAPTAGSAYKVTFQSRVDGSAQYVSIVPPLAGEGEALPALVMSLHGASVEATNQAASYAPRAGYLIACPTNRRPFGFDWEDWGRIDAIESMDFVKTQYKTDPRRQYLTGHSMGGHGTWNIGVLYPQRFAAFAPSAGWLSFDTYTSRNGPSFAPEGSLGDLFRSARASSDTLEYFKNLAGKGIYILHGDKDDNVPVEQARKAREALDGLGIPYQHHEQAGAGHWWDDDKPGAACLDWPGIWEVFNAHQLDETNTKPPVAVPLDDRGFSVGTFKRVFDKRFVLVYSTGGSQAENAWSFAKARFDAEQWWYRGNGRALMMSDADFLAQAPRCNVILYGHSKSLLAWKAALGDNSAVRIEPGLVKVGDKQVSGEDVGVLAVLPRSGMPDFEVGIIGGSGLPGMKATERLVYFSSGVGYPQITLLRSSIWRTGFRGVAGAGTPENMVWNTDRVPSP